jgi:hypothetical protein
MAIIHLSDGNSSTGDFFVYDDQDNCVGAGPSVMDALIDAESTLRILHEEVQRLLTAEREKTRTDKPQSSTY